VIAKKEPSTALSHGLGRREKERPARTIGQPFEHLGLFVSGGVVDDGVDGFSRRDGSSTALRNRMNSWWRCCLMPRPIRVPSRMLSARTEWSCL
jgi:hypothetical protein